MLIRKKIIRSFVIRKFVWISFSMMSLSLSAQTTAEQNLTNTVAQITKNYPVPSQTKSLIFYLQRNKNANTVVYEANFLANGKLDPKNPVSVYWLRFAEGGEKKELSWMQRWLAYGVDYEPVKDGSGTYILSFVSLKNKKILLSIDPDGRASAYMPLNGKNARINRIYAQAQETNWLPTVKFVQVMGEEVKTKQSVIEYLFPKK